MLSLHIVRYKNPVPSSAPSPSLHSAIAAKNTSSCQFLLVGSRGLLDATERQPKNNGSCLESGRRIRAHLIFLTIRSKSRTHCLVICNYIVYNNAFKALFLPTECKIISANVYVSARNRVMSPLLSRK